MLKRQKVLAQLAFVLLVFTALAPAASAQVVPYWPGSNTVNPAVGFNFQVAPWPAESAWRPYTINGSPIQDPRTQDPSNGGTSPQGYVNVASGCPDQTLPSIYVAYEVYNGRGYLFFRWRVESAPNNYTTGGAFGATNPWNSALYTVLVDINGDGYRDFAFHLDGSSGAPSTPVDQVRGIYSTELNQSVDYLADPAIKVTGTNPAAFVDQLSGVIENFQGTLNPVPSGWSANASFWDYGTTRTINLSTPTCIEYFVDYQIPIGAGAFFDARPLGGPWVVYGTTPIALGFVTSNSLNNSLQKDAALNQPYTACMTCPYPFGDPIVPATGIQQAPIVNAVTLGGSCGATTLTASVTDTIVMSGGVATRTVAAVDFYYYADTNANGVADDGSSAWTLAAHATPGAALDQWTATWNSASLPRGQYLIGVKATDNEIPANTTWSFYDAPTAAAQGANNYANPLPTPGIVTAVFNNSCGVGASIAKTGSTTNPVAGGTIDFTLTVTNPLPTPITLSSLSDVLPTGTFVSNVGGTLSPTTSPSNGDTSLGWTFSPAVTIAGSGGTATLVFTVQLTGTPVGTYSNVATAGTSDGNKTSPPFTFGVGSPQLAIAKTASSYNPSPGDTLTYTLQIANTSTVGVTNVVVTDVLPAGLVFVSASDGGTNAGGTITWNLGSLGALSSRTITYTVTVQTPFPSTTSNLLVNNASVVSTQTPTPVSTSTTVVANVPRPNLVIEKLPNSPVAQPGGTVQWTINYQNIGSLAASGVTISDTIPSGFTFNACSNACTNPGAGNAGAVSWSIGSVPANSSLLSVTLTLNVVSPYTGADPASNTATITGTGLPTGTSTGNVAVSLPPVPCTVASDTRYFISNSPLASPFPMSLTAGGTEVVWSGLSVNGAAEVARFVDPTPETAYSSISNVTVHVVTDRGGTGGNGNLDGSVELLSVSGATITSLAQTATISNLFNNTKGTISVPFTGNYLLAAGAQLGVRVNVVSNQAGRQANVYFNNGTTGSRIVYCKRPILSGIDKAASALSIQAGQSLSYAIRYSNTISDVSLTNARVQDTLPAGVTFVNATLAPQGGGTATANCTQAGQVVTCGVQSAAVPAAPPVTGGTLGPCGTNAAPTNCSGTLTMNVTVDAPLSSSITSLGNSASLLTTEAPTSSATSTTTIIGPRLTLLKAVDLTSASPGQNITYAVTALNTGSATANSVVVTDVLASGLSFVSCTIGAPATGTCSAAGQTVTATLTSPLAAGASAGITIVAGTSGVTPSNTTPVTNVASAAGQGASPAATINATSNTVATYFPAVPNLLLSKSGARVPAGTLAPGDTLQYTLTISNVGTAAATNVAIADAIPANTTYASLGTPSAGSASYDLPTNTVGWTIPSLGAGASATLTFQVTVASGFPAGNTTLTNTATASAANAASRTATATNTVTANPALAVSKAGPDMNSVALATLSAAASNTNVVSVSTITGFVVGDNVQIGSTVARVTAIGAGSLTLSANVTAASGATVYDLATGGPVPYQLTTLTSSPSASTTFTVATTLYLNAGDWISINGTTSTQITAIDTGTSTVTVNPAVTGTSGQPLHPILPFTLTYQNTGNAAATSVTLTDVLASGLTYVTSAPSGCSASGQTVTCTVASVAAGGSGTFVIWALPGATGDYANAATIASAQTPPVPSNNVRTSVGALRILKSTSTPSVTNNGGTTANYSITIVNESSAIATGVNVTDPLPSGFTYRSGTTGGTAGAAEPTLGPSPTFYPTWGPLTVAANATVTITFTANVASSVQAGTYNNPLTATSTNLAVTPFDETATTAEDVSVSVPADFAVTANVSVPTPCSMPCAAQVSFTISDVGSQNSSTLSVHIDAFPSGITFTGGLPPGVVQNGDGSFTWTPPNLVTGGSCTGVAPNICTATVTFPVSISSFGSYTQCAALAGSTPTDVNSANDSGCAVLAPTRVSLASFGVTQGRSGAEVTWVTAGEAGTVGFHVFRREGNEWVPVGRALLPALLTSPAGGTYRVVDARAAAGTPQTYLLVETEIGGGRIAYGPFRFGAAPAGSPLPPLGKLDFRPGIYAQAPVVSSSEGDAPSSVGFVGTPAPQDPVYKKRVDAAAKANAGKGKGQKKDGTPAVKVIVGSDGLTFIDSGSIASLLALPAGKVGGQITSGRLALSNRGKSVAWLAAPDLSGIYFYGEGLHTDFTNENVYWLTIGAGLPMAGSKAPPPATSVSPDQVFAGHVHAEVDTDFGRGTTDAGALHWYWKDLYGGVPGYDAFDFPVTLESAAPGAGEATLTVHVYGGTSWPASPDHHVSVAVNGLSVGSDSWDGEGPHDVTLTFPSSYLRSGANTVGVTSSLTLGIPYALDFVDSIDVSYPRHYRTAADLLVCRGDGNVSVTVSGFASQNLVVLDITDPAQPAVRPSTVSAAPGGGWQATFAPASPSTPYLVAVASSTRAPKALRATVTPSPLLSKSNRADWAVLTVPEIADAAQRLASRRQAQGLETQVVLLEDVMDAFNEGIPDPRAIRAFVAYAHNSWAKPLRYLLIAGDGSYDYQNVFSYGGNVVPTLMVGTPFGGAASDVLYGDVDGDNVPEVSVGRIPVLSAPELDAVTAKIAAYEDGPRTGTDTRLVLLADLPDAAAGAFPEDCDDVAAVTNGVPFEKVYRTAVPADAARAAVLSDLRSGTGFLTFAGHSSIYWLSVDQLLTKDDVPTLGNLARLPLVTATTCFIGAFQVPGFDTLGERLVDEPTGGSVAVLSSSLLSMDLQARTLTLEYHRALWDKATPTIGDAFRVGLGAFVKGGGVPWMARTYVLLGDPATRTRIP